ncbi:MAG TPA: PadR family transcriptional regulator [Euryarchaeota archaeon]|nr:lineage-specific thermal regulator protein [archaeon BMS3Abin16]GBE56789.1 lineage-specific thermal regulator protein [archaeon BMS3Bbin16]HDH28978.1 PadR family transcriptional regulator [Euryarchaeota archaeon]
MPLDRLKKKTSKEILWIYILRLLTEREMYAYELKQALQDRFEIDPARITSYVVLYRLENEGYVSPRWQENKKYYKITDEGMQLLEEGIKYLESILGKLMI